MRCRSARILITRQLRETPAPEASAALSRHLARCSRCRAEQVELRALAAQLAAGQSAPALLPAPVAMGWTERLLHSSPHPPAVRHTLLPWPRWAPFTAATGLLFALLIAHSLRPAHRHHGAARERGSRIASRGGSELPVRRHESGEGSKFFDAKTRTGAGARSAGPGPASAGQPGNQDLRSPDFLAGNPSGIPSDPDARAYSAKNAPSPSSRSRVDDDRYGRTDDLAALNNDPLGEVQRWTSLPIDQWQKIEARVRTVVRVRDDFVTIPFPRIASSSDRAIAQAVESYKREAAIVDPRLSREVTCAFKGMALSDICEQLKAETGIQLSAGASVADEKVTLFCEKLPLREVMRQLSRPFGYTWLRSKKEGGEYRYELVQDLRSQLLEEELRNRDRDAALLDLQKEIDRYRPYLGLSPDEALAWAKTAAPEEKKLLENYAGWGWGPLQLYARLSPQEQAALRAGQTISFSGDPQRIARDGAEPLPPDLERGVLQSMRGVRVRRPGSQTSTGPVIGGAQNLPDGVPPASSPEANGFVVLRIAHSELGQFTFDGGSGVTVGDYITVRGHDGDLGRGVSPAVQDPKNEIANARLAHDPALQRQVAVAPVASSSLSAGHPTPASGDQAAPEKHVTTADVLEALHHASGMPIVADYYTHLYPQASVSVKGQSLFEALNHLADAMHLRWNKDSSWLQFRSASYYDDRVKEVPNRLLARWAAARRQHDGLPLDVLIEMAQLSDAQLDSSSVSEGVKELWGLEEWSLAQNHDARPHLRYLAQLTPAQRQMATSAAGLSFSQLSLAQQQGLIAHLGERLPSLDALAGATVRVEYTQPGWFRWPPFKMPGSAQPGLFGLAQVRAPTRAAALSAARLLDAQASEAQIAPTDLSLTVVYTLTDPGTGKTREWGMRTHGDGALISW